MKLRVPAISLAMAAIFSSGACWGAEPLPPLLGQLDFPNSGSAEAQPHFIEGVLYLHSFEYEQARASFRRARQVDDDFAMAYWGETMTHHQSIWGVQDQEAGEAVLRSFGRTPEARAVKAPTPRERGYLRAIELLFGAVKESKGRNKSEREILYREAMRQLHEAYPEDHEATTFYGLSILGAGKKNRDFATYMRAAGILIEVWDANRMHPGAAHYLIHSFDDSTHSPLGLPMARAYSKIAPAAAHAQHMTSHIFLGLGMWEEMVTANETAFKIEVNGTDEWSREASHYVHWLHYGYLQQGRYRQAEKLLEIAQDRLHENTSARERGYYGTLFARHLLETGAWESMERWAAPAAVDIPSPNYYYAQVIAAIERGDADTAREIADNVKAGGAGNPEVILGQDVAEVLQLELRGKFALAAGDRTTALALFREAASRENAMPPKFGPPAVVKPAAELLGDLLLELGRADEAMAAYKDQLVRTPRRAATLLGLVRAAHLSNDANTEANASRLLWQIWSVADENVRETITKQLAEN
jgi:tetratricopeptide (TPR) repeat protein